MYFLNPLRHVVDAVYIHTKGRRGLGIHPFADPGRYHNIDYYPAAQTAITYNDSKVIDVFEIKSLRADYSLRDEIAEEEEVAAEAEVAATTASSEPSLANSSDEESSGDESTGFPPDIWGEIALESLPPPTKFPRSQYRRLSSRKASRSSTGSGPSQSSPVPSSISSHSHSPTWTEEEDVFVDALEVQPGSEESGNMKKAFQQLHEMQQMLDEMMEKEKEKEREEMEKEKQKKSECGWSGRVKALLHWLAKPVKDDEEEESEEEWAEWVPGVFWE